MKKLKTDSSIFGKSDKLILPEKQGNKLEKSGAESVEGRGLTKRNTHATADGQTQGWKTITSRLKSVREAAKKDKEVKFSSLLHHITIDLLKKSFYSLKRGSAAGVDGVSWTEYERVLKGNLEKLKEAIQSGMYKPKPQREGYIFRKLTEASDQLVSKVLRIKWPNRLSLSYWNRYMRWTFLDSPMVLDRGGASMMLWMHCTLE